MSAYIVGIDLGTSHTVVAYAPAKDGGAGDIKLFEIDQLIAPGEVSARTLLPSLRYHPIPGELSPDDLVLPWGAPPGDAPPVIGALARVLGAKVPGRLVASAKSWLSHGAVDRLADIQPWGAPAEVPKVSPVAASASYLAHLRSAWNHRFPKAPLERQELVLTVPASFDDAARALTLQAAREAGLPSLRLLEEPQAALYDWLFRHREALPRLLADTRLVLVCDVGGGTTDLSLVRVQANEDGTQRLERVAVGRHLMLGGDNMDLALAHLVEAKLQAQPGAVRQRLAAGHLSQLVERCRAAKERLLAADAPASAPVTLLGGGSRLIGAARTVEVGRDEAERVVVDGFFPQGAFDELPGRQRGSALVAFGLPYASDPAVTRHIAAFLHEHADDGWPDALLLNGGVFKADAIARRLHATLQAWRNGPVQDLHNEDPDVAVARGAVAYALALRGLGPRIGGGSARSYFLLLEAASGACQEQPAVCVLPRGSEEGRELRLTDRSFALRTGQPVRFHLASATAATARGSEPAAGEVVDLADFQAELLPPVATVVRASDTGSRREIPVQLATKLTEVGTLEVDCIATEDPDQRFRLEFQLRAEGQGASSQQPGLPPRFAEAIDAIDRVFGARRRDVQPKEVKQLRARLESLLGSRERWPASLLRPLYDALWKGVRSRRRSADHERVWLSLAGWCLRPGFGDPLDGWRIEQLWPLFEQGVQHGHDAQVNAEWWTLWRRVAGGLDEQAQRRLLDDFTVNLQGDEAGIERPAHMVKGSWDDMVRLGASLERIPAEYKAEIGEWLLWQLSSPSGGGRAAAREVWTLWAIGRIGARVPLYGSAHVVVPPDLVIPWVDVLIALDWRRSEAAAAAAANLVRLSGDRARDVPEDLRERVVERLRAANAPQAWIDRILQVAELDEAGESAVFGEALPPGLKLVE